MPVYGLVLTLSGDLEPRQRALTALGGEGLVTLGEATGLKLPLALESDSVEEGERLYRWLGELPGVMFQELVFVDFSDVETVGGDVLRRRPRHTRQTREGSL